MKLYHYYRQAVENESTFQIFFVIYLTDINTGQTREVCTQSDLLLGAIHREYHLGFDCYSIYRARRIALNNRTRTFKFKNQLAIQNLGIDRYSVDDLREFEKRNDIDSVAENITKDWHKQLNENEMLLYAHCLFNRGILTGQNTCRGGILRVAIE